jgi:hypothetical protein
MIIGESSDTIFPIYMVFTLISVVYGPHWVVAENTIAVDTFETNWEEEIKNVQT